MRTTRISATGLILLLGLGVAGCKERGGSAADAKLGEKLETCEKSLAEVKKIRAEIETELAELSGADNDNVVIELKSDGGILSIRGGKGPNGRTEPREVVGNAKDEELYKKFIAAVKKSRSPMTQCYRRALKNDPNLQARTVTVSVNVSYSTSGKVRSAGSKPKINQAFNKCINGVAEKWSLPAMPKPAAFVAPLTLTPES